MREFTEKYIEIDGFAGSYGAALIFEQNEAEYRRHFREDYVSRGEGVTPGPDLVLHFFEGGIIAAINEVCAQEHCGYELELRKIPIKQFTIEVCELAKVNPYELPCYARVRLVDEKTPASCGRTTQALRKTLIR